MSVSLYRRFRPTTFDKVIGQYHVVNTLKNQIRLNRISHAYLFTGTRGTGKTSTAKIFARAVNCLHPVDGSPCGECEVCNALAQPSNLDVIEIDAASNNSVDNIRDIREAVQYRPSVGRYKVYIIDEVHMLTTSAFNALLKTLEEPPEHVIFILATTEVHKLPQTILSRCQRFDFRLVGEKTLEKHIASIFNEIGVEADDRAITLIARHGEGSVRDAVSVADMLISYTSDKLTAEDVENALGLTSFDILYTLASAIIDGDTEKVLRTVNSVVDDGKNLTNLSKDLAAFFLDIVSSGKLPSSEIGCSEEEYSRLKTLYDASTESRLSKIIRIISKLESELRLTTQPQIIFTAILIEAASVETDVSLENTLTRIRMLEKRVNNIYSGSVSVAIDTKEEKQPQSDESKASMKILRANSTQEEREDVVDERALACWRVAGDILKSNGEFALSGIVSTIKTVRFDGDELLLVTREPGVVSLLEDERYFEKIKEAVLTAGARAFSLRDLRSGVGNNSEERTNKLKELFGGNKQ